jgi:hypothetical protein
VGVLNACCALLLLGSGIGVLGRTPDEWAEDEIARDLLEQGWTVGGVRGLALAFDWGLGALVLLAAIVTAIAGVRMRALKSRGLALTGAVLAIIPCLSPAGCCGLGEAIGIWALIVLAQADVKSAFH